ncbi:DUF3352 domain-containing protein [Candidatus Uabimicrobium sp. HlEnr_7]|uniref:DUF3352 domain-containing protein n=1 Tax=Candidatus Uabimicrobium helgolandensis TaxID=3095367 RepID=UPI0035575688
MQKIFLCIAMAMLVCANAQDNFQLYNQLPERTLVTWRMPNVSESRSAMKESALSKLFNEPEVQNFIKKTIDPFKMHLDGAMGQASQILGMPLEKALGIFHGEVALAIVDINPQQQSVGAVLSIDFGDNREAIDSLLNLAKQSTGFTFAEQQHGEYTLHSVEQMPPHMRVTYTIIGNTLVIGSQDTLLKQIISGTDSVLLKDTENVKAVAAQVHRNGTTVESLYINIEAAMKQFMPMAPPQVAPMMEKLGVAGIKAIGVGVNVAGNNINTDFYMHVPGEKNGVMSLLDIEPVSTNVLKYIPKHSNSVSLMRFDLLKQLNNIKAVLEDVAPDGSLLQMYEQIMSEIERELKFSFDNGLLETVGTQLYSCSYMPEEGGLIPRNIGGVALKDAEKFWQIANDLATNHEISIKKIEFAGQTIHYFSQNTGQLFNMRPFKALPKIGNISGQALLVENNTLYMASSVQDMKSFLEDRPKWKESITTNADFQALQKFLPSEASFVIYLDFREMFNYLWNTAIPILRSFEGIARAAGVPFSVADLPQATTISRHLKPLMTSYASTKDGILMSYTSPMTFILPGASAIGVGAAIAIPMVEKQKQAARKEMVRNRLRTILTAQQMYKLDRQSYGSLANLTDNSYVYGLYSYNNGMFEDGYYHFYIYRAGSGEAVGESSAEEKEDASYDKFVVYAWPMSKGDTVYAMNQEGDIVVTQTQNYNSWVKPEANAAFAIDAENANSLQGSFASGNTGQDSNYWKALD